MFMVGINCKFQHLDTYIASYVCVCLYGTHGTVVWENSSVKIFVGDVTQQKLNV